MGSRVLDFESDPSAGIEMVQPAQRAVQVPLGSAGTP